MKKLLMILFVTLFYGNVIGQVWIDHGAVWHYDYVNVGYWGFHKYQYVQDTMIQGHNCQKITGEGYAFTHDQYSNTVILRHDIFPDQFTYVSGDTVFYLNNDEFFILYNFGASIGDKWVISTTNPFGECGDTSWIEVTDTGKITLNAIDYRIIMVQPTSNSPFGFKGTYVERFGNIDSSFLPFQYLFPGGYQCDSLTPMVEWDLIKFKCFTDSSFTLYNTSTQDCEYDLTHLGIDESNQHDFLCYPNPTSGLINIENSIGGDILVEIYNYQGCIVRTIKIKETSKSIDISDLKAGMYLFKFKSNTRDNCIRIIKE